jgi:hypothetical protein
VVASTRFLHIFDHPCGLFATKVCLEDSILHHSRLLTFTQILLLCNHVIDNLCSTNYYQGGVNIMCLKSSAITVRWLRL